MGHTSGPASVTSTIPEESDSQPEYPRVETAQVAVPIPASPLSPAVRSPAESVVRINPFDTPLSPTPNRTPFRTPNRSRRPSLSDGPSFTEFRAGGEYFGRSSARGPAQKSFFRSRRIRKDEVQTPRELNKNKDRKAKWSWILPLIGMLLGLAISGVLIYLNLKTATSSHNYCSVLNEDFSSGKLNPDIWTIERQVGGFGNGQFEEATDSPDNLFIRNGQLYIKPTLQDEALINKDSVINLTQSGMCTGATFMDCVSSTNVTNGTIVNPVRSARITTKKGPKIKYGRIEVVAKLPKGDWLWPAIWMLPENDVYGAWPRSGEIDILEGRGNNYTYNYYSQGNNVASSALHWGPAPKYDAYHKTVAIKNANHAQWGDGFHTWGLEWSENYIFTYIDSRLLQVLYIPFNKPFWGQGDFPPVDNTNGTKLDDPWGYTGRDSTPFDQDFFLILNVAVGGTNGWFTDGVSGKPWADSSPVARKEFWDARNQWLPTWEKNGEMVVDSVKMWQQC